MRPSEVLPSVADTPPVLLLLARPLLIQSEGSHEPLTEEMEEELEAREAAAAAAAGGVAPGRLDGTFI